MTNLYAGIENLVLGSKDTPTAITDIFGEELLSIVHVDNENKVFKSWQKGRQINTLSQIEKEKGYKIWVSTDKDASEYFAKPLPEGAGGGGDFYVFAGLDSVVSMPNHANLQVTSNGIGVSVQWSQISGPPGVQLSSTTDLVIIAVFQTAGEYVFRVSGTNFQGETASDDVRIIVNNPAGGLGGTRIEDNGYMISYYTTFEQGGKLRGVIITEPKYKPAGVKIPMVFFCHGAGEKSGDFGYGHYNLTDEYGIIIGPSAEVHRRKRPFGEYSVSIQAWNDESHQPYAMKEMYDILTGRKPVPPQTIANQHLGFRKLDIDEDRVYVTGLSDGGNGTYAYLYEYKDIFAAGAPFSGWAYGSQSAMSLLKMPIRQRHNANDQKVGAVATEDAYTMIMSGNPPFAVDKVIYPWSFNALEQEHDSWTEDYAGMALWDWLTSFRRVIVDGVVTYYQDQTPSRPFMGSTPYPIKADITIGGTREGVILNAVGFNTDGTNAAYLWEVLSGTTRFRTNRNNNSVTTSTAPVVAANGKSPGDMIRLTVTNNLGQTATKTITLT